MVDKYQWLDVGSSYLPSELQAAFLWGQLEKADEIKEHRLALWNAYYEGLLPLQRKGKIELPSIPVECKHNAHIFFIKLDSIEERTALIAHLEAREIQASPHYVPLHTSVAGKRFSCFHGKDRYTTSESERLLRLPMYYGLKPDDQVRVISAIEEFYA